MKKIAVVTGANRGLGRGTALELAKAGFHVVCLGRNEKELQDLVSLMKAEKMSGEIFLADLKDLSVGSRLKSHLERQCQHLDVLVNNAGVFLDSRVGEEVSFEKVPSEIVLETFQINLLGPYQLIRDLMPLLKKSPNPRIVNVSSGMGQLSAMESGYPAYRISKAAMNALTKNVSEDCREVPHLKINSVCPGWVRTDMGGSNAHRSIEEGVAGIIWAATLPKEGPTGGFYRDGQKLDW